MSLKHDHDSEAILLHFSPIAPSVADLLHFILEKHYYTLVLNPTKLTLWIKFRAILLVIIEDGPVQFKQF